MDDDWRARSSFDAFVDMGGKACWALTAGQVAVTLSNAGPSFAVGQQMQSRLPVPSWTSVDLYCGGLVPTDDGAKDLEISAEHGTDTCQIGRNQALTATITRSTTHTSCSGRAVNFHDDVYRPTKAELAEFVRLHCTSTELAKAIVQDIPFGGPTTDGAGPITAPCVPQSDAQSKSEPPSAGQHFRLLQCDLYI